MRYWLLPARPSPVLVVRPREHSFGHQVYELLMGFHMARAQGAAVAWWPPAHLANPAVFEIECAEVATLRGAARRRAVAAARRVEARHAVKAALAGLRQGWQRSVLRWLERAQPWLSAARGWRKRYKGGLTAPVSPQAQDHFGLDFRVCYARHRLTLKLADAVAAPLATAARELGLLGTRIAVVHARESGFKAAAGGESPADAIRNARIETYIPALERLLQRGFIVVRIGDPQMTPLRHPGIVDLATSPARTDALELWTLMNSTLFIAGDSGPFAAALLSPAPCVAVNVTNVLGGYPVRASDRYILKRVFDHERGRELTLEEMLAPEYFAGRKDLGRYRVIDNTPEEICDAVEEMLAVLAGPVRPSAEQRHFHRLADAAYNEPDVASRRTRKGEPARQLLGDGFIGRAFATQLQDAGATQG